MASVTTFTCCGWAELHGVQNYRHTLLPGLLSAARTYSKGAFVFSSAVDRKTVKTCGAMKFTKAIEKRKLGVVTALTPFRNPNTNRIILPFLWIVDRVALERYCREANIGTYNFGR